MQVLGVPTIEQWPGMVGLPHRLDFKPAEGVPLEKVFSQVRKRQGSRCWSKGKTRGYA